MSWAVEGDRLLLYVDLKSAKVQCTQRSVRVELQLQSSPQKAVCDFETALRSGRVLARKTRRAVRTADREMCKLMFWPVAELERRKRCQAGDTRNMMSLVAATAMMLSIGVFPRCPEWVRRAESLALRERIAYAELVRNAAVEDEMARLVSALDVGLVYARERPALITHLTRPHDETNEGKKHERPV